MNGICQVPVSRRDTISYRGFSDDEKIWLLNMFRKEFDATRGIRIMFPETCFENLV